MKKIVSFNINGVRAALKKGLLQWLEVFSPDVLCLQEIKATPEQFDSTVFDTLNYNHYWFPAKKKGYSGVAILSKEKPKNIIYGCQKEKYDVEGRILQVDFNEFTVINVYIPSGSNMEKRLEYKLSFCNYFLEYIRKLKKTHSNIIISGDFNICHRKIDIHDPIRNAKVSGFLPVEREWLTNFIQKCTLLDSFRHFNNEAHHYSWWSYRANAKKNNKGWRIDYNFVSNEIKTKLNNAYMMPELFFSDHCPVVVELAL